MNKLLSWAEDIKNRAEDIIYAIEGKATEEDGLTYIGWDFDEIKRIASDARTHKRCIEIDTEERCKECIHFYEDNEYEMRCKKNNGRICLCIDKCDEFEKGE